jgi:acyl-CoA thioesterase-1
MVFSSAVSAGSSWKDWKTKPSSGRAVRRGHPRRARKVLAAQMHLPDAGRSRPAISPSSVDLPEPEAPTMATASPAVTANEISCRIVSVPSPLGTTLPSVATSITASVVRPLSIMFKKLVSCFLLLCCSLPP